MITAVEMTQQEQLLPMCYLPCEGLKAQCQPEIKESKREWKEKRNVFDFMENL